MLDIKYIRENVEEVKENCKNRNVDINIDRLLELDTERRGFLQQIEALRSERKKHSKGGKPSDDEIVRMREVGDKIKHFEERLAEIEEEYLTLMHNVPNKTHADAPIGKDEEENVVLREVGDKPSSTFKPKEHWELGQELDLIDLETAAKVSGSRFAYLKGDLVLMQFALIQLVMSTLTDAEKIASIAKNAKVDVDTRPFTPILPPVMMRPEVMQQMGRLEPRDERYHLQQDDMYMVGSAEHTLGPMHMDHTFKETELPLRYVGYSTAFRREAGSYGKDTKGIFRVHQFDKIEIESFATPETAQDEQDLIVAIQEHFMQQLEIPYRVVFKCTGDMGAPDYREFDIEAWMPGQERYRETHTSDYMTDYQSRRLNTKVTLSGTPEIKEGAEVATMKHWNEYVHMNDATVFAIGRTLIAIMENYQQEDGTIRVPSVLQPYLGGKEVMGK